MVITKKFMTGGLNNQNETTSSHSGHTRRLLIVVAILLVAVAVMGAFLYQRSAESPDAPPRATDQEQEAFQGREGEEREQDREERQPREDQLTAEEPCSYSLDWQPTNFRQSIDQLPYNVTDMLVAQDGTVYAAYNDDNNATFVAATEDGGSSWGVSRLPDGVVSIRALREMQDGRLLLGATGRAQTAILYESRDGTAWEELAQDASKGIVLPNETSTSVWDIVELPGGEVLIVTDSRDNNPDRKNMTLYLLEGDRLSELASFPGLGLLAAAVNDEGLIVVATEESDEHDDPELAGQARIFISADNGVTWDEGGVPQGANRIYDLHFHSSGVLYAGTGIRGELLYSSDNGMTWRATAHVPETELPFGEEGGTRMPEASRVYQILELCDGSMLVGTGNNGGAIFYTDDGGKTWQETEDTGPNNVVWGLAQEEDGTIWIGTGSRGGDVLTTK